MRILGTTGKWGVDVESEPVVTTLPGILDVAIIGAGPAGLTLAALRCRHRPATRVAVFEKAEFPRFKIGESLVVDVNRVLADMGALAAVEDAGFIRKVGATFLALMRATPSQRCPSCRIAGGGSGVNCAQTASIRPICACSGP